VITTSVTGTWWPAAIFATLTAAAAAGSHRTFARLETTAAQLPTTTAAAALAMLLARPWLLGELDSELRWRLRWTDQPLSGLEIGLHLTDTVPSPYPWWRTTLTLTGVWTTVTLAIAATWIPAALVAASLSGLPVSTAVGAALAAAGMWSLTVTALWYYDVLLDAVPITVGMTAVGALLLWGRPIRLLHLPAALVASRRAPRPARHRRAVRPAEDAHAPLPSAPPAALSA